MAKQDQYDGEINKRAEVKFQEALNEFNEINDKFKVKDEEKKSKVDKLDESLKNLAKQAEKEDTDITGEQSNKIF